MPIVLVKKYVYTKIIRRIPRSGITPAADNTTTEQDIEIKSIHTTPNINVVESIVSIAVRPIIKVQSSYNVTKNNKNLISFAGVSILVVFFLVLSGIIALFRFGWITAIQIQFYVYAHQCCLPVILPTIYFMQKPNHLVVVMKDLNLL